MTQSEPDSSDDADSGETQFGETRPGGTASAAETDPGDEELPWPIGFMILAGLAGLYLAWRLVQLIGRGIDWLF